MMNSLMTYVYEQCHEALPYKLEPKPCIERCFKVKSEI